MEKNNETSSDNVKRIVIIGPESTGKTTLSEQLANHYKTVWVPEYAREYVDRLEKKYTLGDIEIIAKKQLELEDKQFKQADHFLFCDTNLIVCKIWAEHAFGKCPQWMLDEIKQRHYDLYLLADIDLPWVADSQREHSHLRKELLNRYKNELEKRKVKYITISGVGKDRINNAIAIIKEEFPKK